MNDEPYVTKLSDVSCGDRVQVGSRWYSTEPLRDSSTGLYARLDFADAEAACKALGGRLPTPAEVVALHEAAQSDQALELSPVLLPTPEMVKEAGCQAPVGTPPYEAAAQALRVARMGGLNWAQIHDADVKSQCDVMKWDGKERLANAGKHWVRIDKDWPAPGRAYLCGWWYVSGTVGRFIQPVPVLGSHGPHGSRDEHDYGTTTLCVWDHDPDKPPPVTREVPREATPTDELSLAAILRDAFDHTFDYQPALPELGVAWAHIAHENRRGQALWNHNYGNISAGASWPGDYYSLPTHPPDPVPSMHFRSYADHLEGAADYWRLISGRYRTAFSAFVSGDPAGAVRELKAANYFTADEGPYEAGVSSLYREFQAKIAGQL